MRTVRTTCRGQLTLAIAFLGIAGCQPAAEDAAVENDTENQVLPLPPLPVAEPPMNREALLLAVAKAASAAALGRDDAAAQRGLDGKRFEVRIRFGCTLPGQAATPTERFGVSFDEEGRTLRLRASPDLGMDDAAVKAIVANENSEYPAGNRRADAERTQARKAGEAAGSETIEAVEGFWLKRPWLLGDGCPVSSSGTSAESRQVAGRAEGDEESSTQRPHKVDAPKARPLPPAAANESVGIAQFFTEADARSGRRGSRAYETTKVLASDEQPSAQGYNLVLSGRLRRQSLGRVISCALVSNDAPPQCLVSVKLDRVWMEQPGSKQIVAEWGS